jgi:hypothetical protein
MLKAVKFHILHFLIFKLQTEFLKIFFGAGRYDDFNKIYRYFDRFFLLFSFLSGIPVQDSTADSRIEWNGCEVIDAV